MEFIELIYIFIFGIVEGITEWLPISSTGHMILINELIQLNVSEEFWNFFLVVIQLGAILAVCVCFFHKLNPLSPKKSEQEKKDTWNLWLKVLVACLPAAVIGLLFDDYIEKVFNNFLTVSITLIIYGILFILIEIFNKKREFKIDDIKALSFRTALIIGGIQILAVIPGTSRSGVTILGAMLIGCNRTVSAEFSFFLSIPVMVGASLLKGVKFLTSVGMPNTTEILMVLIGMIVAFGVSMVVIKFLMNFIKKRDFKVFGYYRIVLGIILIIFASVNGLF